MSYNTKNYTEQGGNYTVVGGTLTIKEGATLNIETGANLNGLPKAANQAASTETTSPTTAEFNALMEKLKSVGIMTAD